MLTRLTHEMLTVIPGNAVMVCNAPSRHYTVTRRQSRVTAKPLDIGPAIWLNRARADANSDNQFQAFGINSTALRLRPFAFCFLALRVLRARSNYVPPSSLRTIFESRRARYFGLSVEPRKPWCNSEDRRCVVIRERMEWIAGFQGNPSSCRASRRPPLSVRCVLKNTCGDGTVYGNSKSSGRDQSVGLIDQPPESGRKERPSAENLKSSVLKIRMSKRRMYLEYLRSEHWADLRKSAVKLQPSCLICQSRQRLCAHHIRYRPSLYDCTVSDLRILCERCHDLLHRMIKRRQIVVDRLSVELAFECAHVAIARVIGADPGVVDPMDNAVREALASGKRLSRTKRKALNKMVRDGKLSVPF